MGDVPRTARRTAGRTVEFGIAAELDNVSLVGPAIRAIGRSGGLSDEAAADLELAVIEALTNIVRHSGPVTECIRTRITVGKRAIVVDIIDRGRPIPRDRLYRPAEASLVFDPAAIPTDGRGLALIRLSVDAMSYATRKGVNRMRLTKQVGNGPARN